MRAPNCRAGIQVVGPGSIFAMTAPGFGGPQPSPRPAIDLRTAFRRTLKLGKPVGPLLIAAAIPVILEMIVLLVFAMVALPPLILRAYAMDFTSLLVLVPAVLIGGGVVVGLANTQLGAATAIRVSAAGIGRPISLGQALNQTRSVFIRALPVWLLVGTLQWSAMAGLGWWLQNLRRLLIEDRDAAGVVVAQLLLALILWALVASVSILLQVKLFLFVPILALEGADGFTALGRSWVLTKGAILTVVVGLLLVGMVSGSVAAVASPIVEMWMPDPTSITSEAITATSYLAPAVVLAMTQLISLFTTPALWLYSTVIYRYQAGLDAPVRPRAFTTHFNHPSQLGYPVNPNSSSPGYPPSPGRYSPRPSNSPRPQSAR